MKNRIKRLCRWAYYVCFYTLSKLCFCKGKTYSHDESMSLLRAAGYDFRPLWTDCPPLLPDSITLSIVIPVYNSKKYLAKCLDTILHQQTQYTYEVICVNDGSTDNSGEIIEQFRQQFPNILRSIYQENQGIAAARNTGIASARGEYIGFIDNDDYVSPTYVESILAMAQKHDADIVQTGYHIATPQGAIRATHSKGYHLLDTTNKEEWVQWVQGFVWGGCYRKDTVFNKIRFTPGFWYEDMITRSLFMRQCSTIVVMREPLYFHTDHAENAAKIHWKDNNIKSVDQYWLARSFADYLITEQHIAPDNTMFVILSHEWSGLLYDRMKGLPLRLRKATFFLTADYMHEIGMDSYVAENGVLRAAVRGLATRNYRRWQCAARAYIQYSRLKRA